MRANNNNMADVENREAGQILMPLTKNGVRWEMFEKHTTLDETIF